MGNKTQNIGGYIPVYQRVLYSKAQVTAFMFFDHSNVSLFCGADLDALRSEGPVLPSSLIKEPQVFLLLTILNHGFARAQINAIYGGGERFAFAVFHSEPYRRSKKRMIVLAVRDWSVKTTPFSTARCSTSLCVI
ncbi:hypothetical protein SAMN04488032_102179 [Pacificibacter marinus]|uniref:Uncharacterized protein n=1 Tax=Pacificibacter marinus TaxID=658057 RepID=A0A1Y5RVJ8_9RHOB|nr:hypothetical protein SAMN04488032_102179 [Pacificibacter marinus]SLN25448.1 hypothetical protein PAM7971_00909 [Pacificibacter marinus]